ncbi:MAG: hypothetical protein QNK23_10580 [Crocinitomicaceae bacterium]|nr:hypothetical protein [Crocinitomicaceae bacterium]
MREHVSDIAANFIDRKKRGLTTNSTIYKDRLIFAGVPEVNVENVIIFLNDDWLKLRYEIRHQKRIVPLVILGAISGFVGLILLVLMMNEMVLSENSLILMYCSLLGFLVFSVPGLTFFNRQKRAEAWLNVKLESYDKLAR